MITKGLRAYPADTPHPPRPSHTVITHSRDLNPRDTPTPVNCEDPR